MDPDLRRIDGFEEVTTHYSPSAWASVTQRVEGHGVRRPLADSNKEYGAAPLTTR
jgi:hypothetical protein